MKLFLLLSGLVLVSAACAGMQTGSQSGTGTAAGISAIQPPVTSPIAPDNTVPIPHITSTEKPRTTKGKSGAVGGVIPITISFRPWKGLVTIDGLANGNNPARFIVSTGLNMSTVSPEDATRLQLTTSDTKAHVAVLDASTDVPTASILNLRIGAGTLHNINVAQVNLITLLTHDPVGDAPTCWLGTNWLSDYLVTIDFDTHQLTLNNKKAPYAKPTGSIVPFKLINGMPVVKVNLAGGGTFEAIVDTGEMGTLIPSAIALKLKAKKIDKLTPKLGTDIGNGMMGRMVVPRISVGKAELKNLMVAYYGAAAPARADKTMAVIGLDFLRRFRVTFNYAKSQIELYAPQAADTTHSDNPVPGSARKPGAPFGTGPFGTNPPGSIPNGANPSGTNPTGTIPH